MSDQEELRELAAVSPDTKLAPAHGIAAIALSMAMKYHDINTVQEGLLYQQYKLEGKNMTPLHLDMVFETAIRIEIHLLGSSHRIAELLVEALTVEGEEDGPGPDQPGEAEAREAGTDEETGRDRDCE